MGSPEQSWQPCVLRCHWDQPLCQGKGMAPPGKAEGSSITQNSARPILELSLLWLLHFHAAHPSASQSIHLKRKYFRKCIFKQNNFQKLEYHLCEKVQLIQIKMCLQWEQIKIWKAGLKPRHSHIPGEMARPALQALTVRCNRTHSSVNALLRLWESRWCVLSWITQHQASAHPWKLNYSWGDFICIRLLSFYSSVKSRCSRDSIVLRLALLSLLCSTSLFLASHYSCILDNQLRDRAIQVSELVKTIFSRQDGIFLTEPWSVCQVSPQISPSHFRFLWCTVTFAAPSDQTPANGAWTRRWLWWGHSPADLSLLSDWAHKELLVAHSKLQLIPHRAGKLLLNWSV